ncbi:calreticulin [Pyrus ussuriensis x Pyrus communis]|uniref:Calreticulin n=1 Tax=Pyrus ussuriensis x Pyrus communis TaxID=2448454 RepID=A0A5N5FIW9_9ROSA|nr:calreticulin [Pyrus ussuriensis x Pyrus communis]
MNKAKAMQALEHRDKPSAIMYFQAEEEDDADTNDVEDDTDAKSKSDSTEESAEESERHDEL